MSRFVRCDRCKESMPEEESHQHLLDQCKAAARTYALYKHGYRPFPIDNSLPEWLRGKAWVGLPTRGAYNGEPREEKRLLPTPTEQAWFPRWVDVIVELWAGPIHIGGPLRVLQRDAVLREVNIDPRMQLMVVDAYAEDLRAVRELLKPIIVGSLPKLLSEHLEDRKRGLV